MAYFCNPVQPLHGLVSVHSVENTGMLPLLGPLPDLFADDSTLRSEVAAVAEGCRSHGLVDANLESQNGNYRMINRYGYELRSESRRIDTMTEGWLVDSAVNAIEMLHEYNPVSTAREKAVRNSCS